MKHNSEWLSKYLQRQRESVELQKHLDKMDALVSRCIVGMFIFFFFIALFIAAQMLDAS
jgi:hypothetical protein